MKLNFLKALKEEDHRRALLATLIYMMLSILFFFLVSMSEPDPPIVEKIIPIDMENIVIPEEIMEEIEALKEEGGGGGEEGHANPVVNPVVDHGQQEHIQDDESVEVNANPANNPRPDDGLTFGGNQGDGSSTDDGTGFGSGPDVGPGVGSGEGTYNGSRKVSTPPQFNGQASEEGTIALEIWVDEFGNVVKTRFLESESTSGNDYLIKLAQRAAKTMKYEKKTGAGIEKVHYEKFTFKKV